MNKFNIGEFVTATIEGKIEEIELVSGICRYKIVTERGKDGLRDYAWVNKDNVLGGAHETND